MGRRSGTSVRHAPTFSALPGWQLQSLLCRKRGRTGNRQDVDFRVV